MSMRSNIVFCIGAIDDMRADPDARVAEYDAVLWSMKGELKQLLEQFGDADAGCPACVDCDVSGPDACVDCEKFIEWRAVCMSEEKVDRCHKCGGKELTIDPVWLEEDETWEVYCETCGETGPRAGSQVAAVAAWNAAQRTGSE